MVVGPQESLSEASAIPLDYLSIPGTPSYVFVNLQLNHLC